MVDIRTILHHMRSGASNRAIHRELGVDRRTAKKYRKWAQEQGLLKGELPSLEALAQLIETTLSEPLPPQNQSSVAAYADRIIQLHKRGVEIAAIHQRLKEDGYNGNYWPVYRFVRKLAPVTPNVTVRIERKPGEEVQVDFGYAGMMIDPVTGKRRKSWAFVMTMSWSRHQYVEFVFDQKVGTWLRCHRNAFCYFGGVPERVVIDNPKAAITKACWHDPQIQLTYQECAEHYGFRIAPCAPATPQHKGKVEKGGVHYVKRNFLAGRDPTPVTQANREALIWCKTTAGLRIHGTTKEQPLVRFQEVEQSQLHPLPTTPYDPAVWKEAKLHRDCHLIFDHAYYSAPFRLVNQKLRVRGGSREVRIYTQDFQLVATHERAQEAGERHTHPAHLPPELVDAVFLNRESCQTVAQDIGPASAQVVQILLDDEVVDRQHTVRRLLSLRDRFGDQRLEAACQRALEFDDPRYMTVKRILQNGLERQEVEPEPIRAPAQVFVRSAGELLGHLFGGEAWN